MPASPATVASGGVAFDATLLAAPPGAIAGHTMRGIGRYVAGVLDALVAEQPWADERLRPVLTDGQARPPAGKAIVTRRATWRAQDLGPWVAALADRWAARRAQPALWHSLDPNLPFAPLADRRTVMTAHDLIPLHEPAVMGGMRLHRRLIYRRYLARLRRAGLVIAVSHVTARDLESTLGVPSEHIRVIYPALVPPPSAAEGAVGAGALLADEGDLLFVGVPEPTKQAELAIDALAECRRRGRPVVLHFVGHHRPADRARLIAHAASRSATDAVRFHGRVDDATLTRLYRRCVLLAVSRLEGFGLPPVEALLAGGRVVAGSAPVYRETLGEHVEYAATADGGGVADAYEAALGRVSGTPPAALVERHSPHAIATALIAAYEEALP